MVNATGLGSKLFRDVGAIYLMSQQLFRKRKDEDTISVAIKSRDTLALAPNVLAVWILTEQPLDKMLEQCGLEITPE